MVLPHVGLVALLCIYTLAGATVFHLFEQPNEIIRRTERLEEIFAMHRNYIETLWNISLRLSINETVEYEKFYAIAQKELLDMASLLQKSYSENIIRAGDLRANNMNKASWSYLSSIFFASTVITTIGYGHVVPTTIYGKIFCIIFALFGIPLLLITIADIGKFMSDFISFLYRTYRLCKFHIKLRSRQLSPRRKLDENRREEIAAALAAVDSDTLSQNGEIRIPVVMVILVLASYTAIGGVLFQLWEGWTYFEAFYFCFITMATIGFGDLVPTSEKYMLFTMLYIVVGLAITTMCIDLAGTEYIRKIHYVGTKMENAKDLVSSARSGLKTAGDRLVRIRDVRRRLGMPGQLDIDDIEIPAGMSEDEFFDLHPELAHLKQAIDANILYRPIHPDVQRILKPHIKLRPSEITEEDAFIVENAIFDRAPSAAVASRHAAQPTKTQKSGQVTKVDKATRKSDQTLFIVPFMMHESNV